MKTSEKIRTSFLLIVIFLLIGILVSSNKPIQVQNKTNLPEGYKAVMFYHPKTGKIFAKGYDYFTYGLDSAIYEVNVNKGENSLYFVLYDMSIEFVITKYDE